MLFEYPCIKEFQIANIDTPESTKPEASHEVPKLEARLRAHNAKSVNLCLGALGAPSRKCATWPDICSSSPATSTHPNQSRLRYGALHRFWARSTNNWPAQGGASASEFNGWLQECIFAACIQSIHVYSTWYSTTVCNKTPNTSSYEDVRKFWEFLVAFDDVNLG